VCIVVRWLVCTAGLMLAVNSMAQYQKPAPSAQIYGQLQQLNNLTGVLYVAAHPDDENTRLLSWLARGQHVRTAYLSVTRGDGGQNIIGPEQGGALGLIRTHELMAARRIDGALQYFARAVDFGYSKSAQETFKHWDELRLIADVVRTIRLFRPDVVITRFPPDSRAGHGHHTASAIIAEKAFDYCTGSLALSSADAARMQDMLDGTQPWVPQRLLFNAYRFGNNSTITDGMFRLDVGHFDPLLGMGYGELAGISRSIHRSQGVGTPSIPGIAPEYFSTTRGTAPRMSLFDGIVTDWRRVNRADIADAIGKVIKEFSMTNPSASVPELLRIRTMIEGLDDPFWRSQKLDQITMLLLQCAGIRLEATVAEQTVLAGEQLDATLRIIQRTHLPVTVTAVQWPDALITYSVRCQPDSLVSLDKAVTIPPGTPVTEPYWLMQDPEHDLFTISNDRLLDHPVGQSPLQVRVTLHIGNSPVMVSVPLSNKRLDPERGDIIEELRVVPRASIEPVSATVIRRNGTAAVSVRIRAFRKPVAGSLRLMLSGKSVGAVEGISIAANTDTLVTMPIAPDISGVAHIELVTGEGVISRSVQVISYEHVPTLQYTKPARVTIVPGNVACTAKTVGYVAGAGDAAPQVLRDLGVQVDELVDADIVNTEKLAAYDAIVVGVRAANVRKSMQYLMPSLLHYAEHGGTLIVQYNTTQTLSTQNLGPWPIPLSRNRVTEEDAPVTILAPDHPVFTHPNKIDKQHFDGWVQERGLYFPDGYASEYQELLSMADEGEPQHRGSLLYGRYGSGLYYYCALSLFRQLPAGVEGGILLLANMVSTGVR